MEVIGDARVVPGKVGEIQLQHHVASILAPAPHPNAKGRRGVLPALKLRFDQAARVWKKRPACARPGSDPRNKDGTKAAPLLDCLPVTLPLTLVSKPMFPLFGWAKTCLSLEGIAAFGDKDIGIWWTDGSPVDCRSATMLMPPTSNISHRLERHSHCGPGTCYFRQSHYAGAPSEVWRCH